jgi:carboxypeptidase Q
MKIALLGALPVSLGLLLQVSPLRASDAPDLQMINRIKNEAFKNSKVMDNAFYLTDVYGPRLTGSPNLQAAGEWAVKKMQEWGLKNTGLEKWGPFGRGWNCTYFAAHLKEPEYAPLIGFPRPWSLGTEGPVSGTPVLAIIEREEDFAKWKGKLKGKIVLTSAARDLAMNIAPQGRRFTDAELQQEGLAPDPSIASPFAMPIPQRTGATRRAAAPGAPMDRGAMRRFREKLNQFLLDEGVAATISPGRAGDGGTLMSEAAGSEDPKKPIPPASIALTPEHYNRLVRLIDHKQPVTLELEVRAKVTDPVDSFNVIGEIPAHNAKADPELVMLGGHLDSWTGGTGATDNAAGCAVALEAVRILTAVGAKMPRTVRLALWSGEEQGIYGSKAYVKKHFADPEVMKPTAEHARVSAYYNLDNGTGKVRGIYLQSNDMARPIFESWLAAFKDLGVETISIRNTGGTDHLSFDAVGIPGFQFIQDPDEYSTRTHHSNMDLYDRLQPGDLMQASAVMATMVYETAIRTERIPRKDLPKPQPKRQDN